MLFHYGYNSKCDCMKNDVRVSLSHLLAPQLCEQISDYNVYCNGCSKVREKEASMIDKGKFLKMCIIEIQLDYFRLNKPRLFFADSPKTVKGARNKKTDRFF